MDYYLRNWLLILIKRDRMSANYNKCIIIITKITMKDIFNDINN